MNLKEHIEATITSCVFDNNEIAIRARGPGGRGDARVTLEDCAIYRTQTGVRAEDMIENLQLLRTAWGDGVKERISFHGGKEPPGFRITGEGIAPPIEKLLSKP